MFSVVLETKSLKFWLLNRTCGEKARCDSPVAVGFWPLTFCHKETGPHFSTVPSRRFSQSLAVLTRRLALAGRRSPRSVGSPSRPPSERTPANVSLDLFRLGSERVTRPNLRRVLRNEFSIALVLSRLRCSVLGTSKLCNAIRSAPASCRLFRASALSGVRNATSSATTSSAAALP